LATITYQFPVSGTVPPTLTQAFNSNMLTATVVFADADTTALITHNWNLSLAQGTDLFPVCIVNPSALGTATVAVGVTIGANNSVSVAIGKAATSAGTGVGATYVVTLLRPHSMIT
jgi:hypothetical protein